MSFEINNYPLSTLADTIVYEFVGIQSYYVVVCLLFWYATRATKFVLQKSPSMVKNVHSSSSEGIEHTFRMTTKFQSGLSIQVSGSLMLL